MKRWRKLVDESLRYLVAAGLALALDMALYSGLIRLAGMDYLAAAPIGFAAGMALIYALSVRWVFSHRRLADVRAEFSLFVLVGLAGMVLNQLVIYSGVERLSLSFEEAKLASAVTVFGFNFIARKLLLFTRY